MKVFLEFNWEGIFWVDLGKVFLELVWEKNFLSLLIREIA